MGPRESNFGTVAGLHETVTWRVDEMVTWKVHETEASFVYSTATSTDINHDFLFRDGITSHIGHSYLTELVMAR
ncbi:hypothetical protein E2C01_043247 [Portunus trituberculatus]|uniref:Uncharacterized protein n=1 Tax=Portunus trituberculatus TaxID=210409 RepID=A0A5B7FV77_PORTR|nr:hypothetical protein [Portunus trituberculatus]